MAMMFAELSRTAMVSAFVVLLVFEHPSALAHDFLAQRTASLASEAPIWHSKTTAKPKYPHELLRRQAQSVVAYVATDNTVGYVDGRVGAVLTCWGWTAVASTGRIGCCDDGTEGCTFSGVCIDNAAFSTSSACPHGCQMDPNTIKCTLGDPFCQPHTIPALGASMYTCADSLVPTVTIETNPAGQSPARVWQTYYDNPVTGSATPSAQASTTSLSGVASASRSSTSSASSATAAPVATEDKPLTTKTIVIIAVAGFAGIIALIVGGLWYYRRNKRRQQVAYRQQPNFGYTYPPPQPFVAAPPEKPQGWVPPKAMNGRPYMAQQNYASGYSAPTPTFPTSAPPHPVSPPPVSSTLLSHNPISPLSPPPPPPPTHGRYEMDSGSRPVPNSSELDSGRRFG